MKTKESQTAKLKRLFFKEPFSIDQNGCWNWPRSCASSGYGQIVIRDETGKHKCTNAHRVSWEVHKGPIPYGLAVCHHCDNPPCCNPDHLYLATKKQNWDDMRERKRNPYGSRHGGARLNEEQVAVIKAKLASGKSQAHIGWEYGVAENTIGNIKRGKNWKHVAMATEAKADK
jgi:hypothetical protein